MGFRIFPWLIGALVFALVAPVATSARGHPVTETAHLTSEVGSANDQRSPVERSSPPHSPQISSASDHTIWMPLLFNNHSPTLLFADAFDNPSSGWLVSDSGATRWSYQDGEYEILLREQYWFAGASAPTTAPATYYLESNARRYSGTPSAYGLIFGWVDSGHFYVFAVNPFNGTYALWRVNNDDRVYLVDWTSSHAVWMADEVNQLAVQREGAEIQMFVNRQPLRTVADSTYTGALRVGLYAETGAASPAAVRFDNLRLSHLGEESTATETRLFLTAESLGHEGSLPPAVREDGGDHVAQP